MITLDEIIGDALHELHRDLDSILSEEERQVILLATQVRRLAVYKTWRGAVLERDDRQCVECGVAENLHVDHVRPFAIILKEGMIETIEQAVDHEPLWDLENGRTLCAPCHRNTDTYGRH